MACSTSSGMLVGPGTARNSRPARTLIALSPGDPLLCRLKPNVYRPIREKANGAPLITVRHQIPGIRRQRTPARILLVARQFGAQDAVFRDRAMHEKKWLTTMAQNTNA